MPEFIHHSKGCSRKEFFDYPIACKISIFKYNEFSHQHMAKKIQHNKRIVIYDHSQRDKKTTGVPCQHLAHDCFNVSLSS
jgi:hypothetical protein